MTDMVELENVNEGKGNTRLPRERYEAFRALILAAVPDDEEGIAFTTLIDTVRANIPEDKRGALGSVGWHVTSVKLDLEAKGLIERIPGRKPQHLRKA